jgi:hypothetical protein
MMTTKVNQVKQFELNRPSLLEINNSVLNGYLKRTPTRESICLTTYIEEPTSESNAH